MIDKKLTIKEAAEQINMNPRSIRRNIHESRLPATLGKIGKMNTWYILQSDLEAFAAARKRPTYDAVVAENKQLGRELRYLLTRVEGGNVSDGDLKRGRKALGDDTE